MKKETIHKNLWNQRIDTTHKLVISYQLFCFSKSGTGKGTYTDAVYTQIKVVKRPQNVQNVSSEKSSWRAEWMHYRNDGFQFLGRSRSLDVLSYRRTRRVFRWKFHVRGICNLQYKHGAKQATKCKMRSKTNNKEYNNLSWKAHFSINLNHPALMH